MFGSHVREETIERIDNAYRWGIPDSPPLLLTCAGVPGFDGTFEEYLRRPDLFLKAQLAKAELIREIGSDLVPTVLPVPLNAALVPSMYGGQVQFRSAHAWTTAKDDFPSELAQGLSGLVDEPPDAEAGLMPSFERSVRYFVRNAPEWVHVCPPSPHDPLESAAMLMGADKLILAALDDPELIHGLMHSLCRTHVESALRMKELTGEPPDRCVTHAGQYLPVTRIANDSIVNLNPEMIHEFCNPYTAQYADRIGTEICVHWCSVPENPGRHVVKAFEACRAITGIATQLPAIGLATSDPAKVQLALAGRFAMPLGVKLPETHLEFRAWAEGLTRRWDPPAGIILSGQVSSVEQGRKLMATWRDVWRGV